MRLRLMMICICIVFLSKAYGENKLWIQSAAANPGTPEVGINILATHDDPIHAFSLAISYAEEPLEFLRLDLDSAGIITGEIGYEYVQVLVDPDNGDLVAGVVMDLEEPYVSQAIPASPTTSQRLGTLYFGVKYNAQPGNYIIQPRNGIGSPVIDNVFSVNGHSIVPELESGTFVVTNPNHLYIMDGKGTPGGLVTVNLEAQHASPLGGFNVAIRYPTELLSIDREPLDDPNIPANPGDPDDFIEADVCLWPITWCGLGLDQELTPGGIDSFRAWAEPDFDYDEGVPGEGTGWIYSDAIFDYFPPLNPPPLGKHLQPGRQAILSVTFRISETAQAGQEIPITLVNNTGIPPVLNTFVVPLPEGLAMSTHPRLHHGAISVIDGFMRGDINNDKRMDLADAINVLTFLFKPNQTIACKKAADINDDGYLDLADPIALLGFIFGSNNNNPMPPPVDECGSDPTQDNLTCEESNC